jgi:hypothetical protein
VTVSADSPRSARLRIATRFRIGFGVCVAVYAALLIPTLARHGIGWDEQTDLGVQ